LFIYCLDSTGSMDIASFTENVGMVTKLLRFPVVWCTSGISGLGEVARLLSWEEKNQNGKTF
jgi:hypothetical protein